MFLQRAIFNKLKVPKLTSFLTTSSVRSFGGVFVNHRPSNDNREEQPFEFTEENYTEIKRILNKFPANYKQSAIISLCMLAQKQNNNFLTLSAMNKVAKILEVPPISIYEVTSFYSMFNREPVGKFHLQVCGTTPCMLWGANEIMEVITEKCGIHHGETSEDGLFTLQEVECLGAWTNAPMMQVNNEWFYEDLTPENTALLIDRMREGSGFEPGPQIPNRKNAEGPQGRTTLKNVEHVFHERDFKQAKEDWLKAKEEAAKAKEAEKKK